MLLEEKSLKEANLGSYVTRFEHKLLQELLEGGDHGNTSRKKNSGDM